MKLDVQSVLVGLRNARHETIMAWSPDPDSEAASHLLNALLDMELAIIQLEKLPKKVCFGEDGEPSEIRDLASALASKARPQ